MAKPPLKRVYEEVKNGEYLVYAENVLTVYCTLFSYTMANLENFSRMFIFNISNFIDIEYNICNLVILTLKAPYKVSKPYFELKGRTT